MVNSFSRSLNNTASLFANFLGACILLISASVPSAAQDLDVPYVPTPHNVVERMLDLADVQPNDYVIDLGSGDGRIVIAAAKRGACGHGIDLDPQRIAEARENATTAGVDDQVMFMEQNIFETDFSEASVITMYLLPSINIKLRPVLLEKLTPGTKVVSHSFDMNEWIADKEVTVESSNGMRNHDIYYWVIPAKVNGEWVWSVDGVEFSMKVRQKFQEIAVTLSDENGSSYDIPKANLQGPRITLRATNGTNNYIFSGRVEGNQIHGMMQHHNGQEKILSKWMAHSTVTEPMK